MRECELALRGIVATRVVGHYRSVFRGRGLEFDNYRNYMPDIDDAQRIDWKASMRTNNLMVKEYVEERDLQIMFVVDVSNSMIFGSTAKLKNEYAVEVVASLANFMMNSGDRIGFTIFNDKIIKLIMPSKGAKQFFILTKTLLDPDSYGGNYDLARILKVLGNTMTKQISMIFIVSDFLGPRNWEKELKTLNKKIETVGIMICDPRDRTLPADSQQIVLADPYSDRNELVDPSLIKERYEKYAKQQEEEIMRSFRESGCDLLKVTTDKSFVVPLAGFFTMRAKKWR